MGDCMKVLAIESAATVAAVAVVEDDKVICDYTMNDKKNHSQTIMPMIEAVKNQLNLDMKTLDAIAVSSGPGSYTGLRIGSATAKGLAHVLDVPIVGISTIESMAHNIEETEHIICPMLDARRQHVFAGAYHYIDGRIENLIEIDQWSVVELVSKLSAFNRGVVFLGDGMTAHKALIEENLDTRFIHIARPTEFLPRAVNTAFLAIKRLNEGNTEDYMTHQPNYYRLSQAEREYQEKHSGN